MSEGLGAGKEVLSYCGKCKLNLSHVIIVMKDSKNIGKVQCKTCGANHAYKDPSTAKKKVARKKSTRSKSVNVSDLWMEKISNATKKSQKYSIKTKFEIGDIIDHVKFGPGIVEGTKDGDKIEVMFRYEIKTLIHNK